MKELKDLTHILCPHCGGPIDLGAPIKAIIEGCTAAMLIAKPKKVKKK